LLLIPIGAKKDGARSEPVATITLVIINIAWFLLLYLSPVGTSWKADAESARRDLEDYWSEHPNLTPPESLARLLGPEEMANVLEEVKAGAKDRRPDMSWLDDLDKKELDRRSRRLEEALADRPEEKYGFVPAHPKALGALTSLFTHGGIVHLGGNMLVLWAIGPFVEAALGPVVFLLFYFGGGLAALLTHTLAVAGSTTPLVGASGAIAAVMGALLVKNAAAKIRFLFLPILWIPRLRFVFGVPAFVVLPLWFVEQVVSTNLEPDAPTAWWAHIGGFIFGTAAGLLGPRAGKRSDARSGVVPQRTRSAPPRVYPPAIQRKTVTPSRLIERQKEPGIEPLILAAPRPAVHGRAWLRVEVVSSGSSGEIVVMRDAETVLRRPLARVAARALALDEVVGLNEGPTELIVELRLVGVRPRATSVLALLKAGESRLLRIELRTSGLAADLR
jgi:membrane associated rhomboid family serine protease